MNKEKRETVFLATSSEASQFLGRAGADTDASIVAMSPSVKVFLEKKGLNPGSSSGYFDTGSHKKLLEKSDEIVKWIKENARFEDMGLGTAEGYESSFIYWTRFSVHHCMWAIEVISRAVEDLKPDSLAAFGSPEAPVSSLYLEKEDKVAGRLAERAASKGGLEFRELSRKPGWLAWRASLCLIYIRSAARFLLETARFYAWLLKNTRSGGRKTAVFTTSSYQMDKAAQKLGMERPDLRCIMLIYPIDTLFYIPAPVSFLACPGASRYIKLQRDHFARLAAKMESERDIFSYRGIFFGDIVAQRLRMTVFNYITGLQMWTLKLDRAIAAISPRIVVSNGNRDDDMITAKLCLGRGIPSLIISHGSHVKPGDFYEKAEWSELGAKLVGGPFSMVAMQSPLAEGYLGEFPPRGRPVKTGPLIWGKPVDRSAGESFAAQLLGNRYAAGKTRVIVHAGTPKPSKSLRLYVYETPEEYLNAIKELAEAVERIEDAVLIVKFRPSPEISVGDIKASVPFSDKVVLSVGEPFLKVLAMADLLVSFSSTTIEEALQNRVPVLLYGGQGRYSHVPAFEVGGGPGPVERSAAYHVSAPHELLPALEGILRLGIDGPGRDKGLFDRYIYPERERVTLEKIIDEVSR